MKTLKNHWGKILLAVLILAAIYYYKVYKPKQEKKKAAAPMKGSNNLDNEVGSEGVTVGNETGSNTDLGFDLTPGNVAQEGAGGDMMAPVTATTRPILTGNNTLRGNPGCPSGYTWSSAENMCIYNGWKGTAVDVILN